MNMFIPSETWIKNEEWLGVGYNLWKSAAPWARDHFLPRPHGDLGGFIERVAEPADVAALNVKVLEELKVPSAPGFTAYSGMKMLGGGLARL